MQAGSTRLPTHYWGGEVVQISGTRIRWKVWKVWLWGLTLRNQSWSLKRSNCYWTLSFTQSRSKREDALRINNTSAWSGSRASKNLHTQPRQFIERSGIGFLFFDSLQNIRSTSKIIRRGDARLTKENQKVEEVSNSNYCQTQQEINSKEKRRFDRKEALRQYFGFANIGWIEQRCIVRASSNR